MNTISREIFEVEIVLLRTLWVKRNAGRGTPAKYLSVYWIIWSLVATGQKMTGGFLMLILGGVHETEYFRISSMRLGVHPADAMKKSSSLFWRRLSAMIRSGAWMRRQTRLRRRRTMLINYPLWFFWTEKRYM